MRRTSATALLFVVALVVLPQVDFGQLKSGALAKVSADQLAAKLASAAGQQDAQVAAELSGLELTERLNFQRFSQLTTALPGEKSRQALVMLADSAALLAPAKEDLVADPQPDAAAMRQMLVNVVNYSNSALHGLPNFIATRATSAFEDRPSEDVLESTGIVSYSYLPLHFVSRDSVQVTYRNGREVLESNGRDERKPNPAHGLHTAGEFGSFLSTVLADAVKGKITWARWERGSDGTDAVFHYQVSNESSHYSVQFCCIRADLSQSVATHIYREKAAYEGEIVFNPATGAVMRLSVQAQLTPGEIVASAGMLVEYADVQVGERAVILPVKSVAILKAHTTAPPEGMHMATFKGRAKTFLNDVVFENYHQFRGEMRIVSDGAVSSPQ